MERVLKSLAITLFAFLPSMAQELKIDHVTAAGKDLRAMTEALKSVGIASEFGGAHTNHATEMALTSFPDGSYLELIAIQKQADPAAVAAHAWHAFLNTNAGPCAWAARPANIHGEVDRLRAASVPVTALQKDGRLRPDGVELKWETAGVGERRGSFFPFLIHDFTPRDRRAAPNGRPTVAGWSGILKVVIQVSSLEEAIAKYRRAYGLPAPEQQDDKAFGAKLAWFRGTPVVLAASLTGNDWLAQRIRDFGDIPCAFVLGRRDGKAVSAGQASKWFGRPVGWFDMSQLGWRLGWED